jgi:hypothetical protein
MNIWEMINSPIVISILASVVVMALNVIYAKKPLWKQYEGTIMSAIRFAEKSIPDGSPNSGLARLDEALRFTIKVYEARTNTQAAPAVISELKEAIQVAHANTDPELL